MLGGVDPGVRGSIRERVLVRARQRQNDIEHARFIIQTKAAQLDRTNADEIEKFNELLNDYWTLLDPTIKKKRKKTAEEQALVLQDFTKVFKEKFAKPTGTFKNFQRAS